MSSANNLNDELSALIDDYSRHTELQQLKHNLYNDPTQHKLNERMAELTQYQGRYVRQDTSPINNYQPQLQQNPYPANMPVTSRNMYEPSTIGAGSRPPQIYQSHANQYAIQNIYNHPMNANGPHSNEDPREDMNSRLDRFRFDTPNQKTSLVPVNMDHVYSGNLFTDGLPVPDDIRGQYHNPLAGNSRRLLHQEKSKTMYRDDVNERLNKLSPLGRTLYYPVSSGNDMINVGYSPQQQTHQQMLNNMQQPIQTSKRGQLSDDINNRMHNLPALGGTSPIEESMLNYGRSELSIQNSIGPVNAPGVRQEPKKVKYMDMYPVMSN